MVLGSVDANGFPDGSIAGAGVIGSVDANGSDSMPDGSIAGAGAMRTSSFSVRSNHNRAD